MAKNYSNKSRKRKAVIAMLCALSVTCTGLAAACAPEEEPTAPSTEVTAKEDTQLLKNGNFEHFDIPDKAVHLIKNVNSWTIGGDTSVKSGIIGTSKSEWDKLTADDLAEKLDYNNDLSTSNDEYVNYNSMRSRDLLYKDNSAALLSDDDVKDAYWLNEQGYENYFGITGNETDGYKIGETDVYKSGDEFYFDESFTKPVRKEMIANPGTHLGNFEEKDGKYYYGETEVYADGDGFYYTDRDLKNPVGNVLMLHNSPTDTQNNNGLHQYYTSATVTLEKQTSAEISLWVKTSDLKFNKGYAANADEQDLGAYIEVIQTVSGSTVDSFQIKAINTAKILGGATDTTLKENNGWLQYTVYVNACDFANSTVQLRLGLGNTENNEKVTGYAFFDDVQVTKYRDLEADETDCTYKDHKAEIETKGTTCTLTDEGDDKIFYADKTGVSDRHAYDFHYLIDLASETGVEGTYHSFAFGTNVKAGLTTETDSRGVEYAAAESIASGVISNSIGSKNQGTLKLPKDVEARPTANDIIGAYPLGYEFKKDTDFSGQGVVDYSKVLNDGLKGADKLPAADGGNMLVTFSAWGAPYTSTVNDGNTFELAKGKYLLVSFWVKTSDMEGSTAATAKIYELNAKTNLPDESSAKSLTIDTTGNTTDFEGEEDIYSGWVQCFFFVKNETGKAGDPAKTFYIDFSFGSFSTSTTSYEGGWAAMANMRTLEINEEIYNLATAGTNTALFEFSKAADENGGTAFAEATGTSDIKEGIAVPDSYTGRNGANASGNVANAYAGLINRKEFENYTNKNDVLDAFYNSAIDSEKSWNGVFGEDCYQPLIIINNLRAYAEKATANENNFKDYWVKDGDNYVKVAADATYDENETYYSLAANYGYAGNSRTVAANGREVVSVRVKVTGDATAYIYLIDDDTDELLNFTTPAYTFWYDNEGNVLDEEYDDDWTRAKHAEHVVYTLRNDGLYEDKDGKIFANLHNLVKSYKDSKYEHDDFFIKDGDNYTPVSFDDLKDGETYYSDNNGTVANHYLCNSDGANVYEYIDGDYFYLEDHKATTKVENFDAEKYARYKTPDIDEKLFVAVTAEDCENLGKDGWVTVNFVIKAGSDSKSYRLELWSGDKNETGVKADGTLEKSGAVAFDYFHGTVSEARLAAYEKEIIEAYNNAITEVNNEINASLSDGDEKVDLFAGLTSGTKENIRTYEELIAGLTQEQRNAVRAKLATYTYSDYVASYYTFTLYDSSSYIPFNANTAADGETGYDYDSSSYTEQLAYLEFNDKSRGEMNVFVDYSAVEQDIPMNTVDDGDDGDDEEENNNTAELGLYISSIVLVVVLLITLASILITQYVKKKRKIKGAKNSDKNVYRKRDRYVKKLHLVKDEIVEPEKDGATGNEAEPAAPETSEEATDTPAEAPAEETAEPTEPTEAAEPAEEKPDGDNDGDNKE